MSGRDASPCQFGCLCRELGKKRGRCRDLDHDTAPDEYEVISRSSTGGSQCSSQHPEIDASQPAQACF